MSETPSAEQVDELQEYVKRTCGKASIINTCDALATILRGDGGTPSGDDRMLIVALTIAASGREPYSDLPKEIMETCLEAAQRITALENLTHGIARQVREECARVCDARVAAIEYQYSLSEPDQYQLGAVNEARAMAIRIRALPVTERRIRGERRKVDLPDALRGSVEQRTQYPLGRRQHG
ncbi:hypothetical protein UFOVP1670_63 [uncultured Caudovirales phage]|uniref:Uncharacterized protein n=1 Tax=uncultured Caudovirales phage TaxID=2100421 RepID=A0A6J5T6T9_9CAUD|nr:hypothetical protein UFOVP1670_63 [uncultured Caudovirales phage]